MVERRLEISLSGSPFFGLTSSHRVQIFKQIHEIVFHGNGGYDWETVYNMPIWLRKYTFNEIREFYEEQNNQQKQQTKSSTKKTLGPDIDPTYISKASRK